MALIEEKSIFKLLAVLKNNSDIHNKYFCELIHFINKEICIIVQILEYIYNIYERTIDFISS